DKAPRIFDPLQPARSAGTTTRAPSAPRWMTVAPIVAASRGTDGAGPMNASPRTSPSAMLWSARYAAAAHATRAVPKPIAVDGDSRIHQAAARPEPSPTTDRTIPGASP